jgi:hypothetical protein
MKPVAIHRAIVMLLGIALGGPVRAADTAAPVAESTDASLLSVLSPAQQKQVEDSVNRALGWLATQQENDGSFAAPPAAQPAVSGLCLLAFLSGGHRPGQGLHGRDLDRAIDFILRSQRETGLFCDPGAQPPHVDKTPSHAAVYSHAIAGLALCEAYGMTDPERARRIEAALKKALAFTRELQARPKTHAGDLGGWRYLYLRWNTSAADSDLSVTGWQLLFLRAARNAEFAVPADQVEEALAFVKRCFVPGQDVFNYALVGSGDIRSSRGMVGVGILSLSMGGLHQTEMARRAGDWLLRHPFADFGHCIGGADRFFYSAYYCSQAMAQLGGDYWSGFYPSLVTALLDGQQADGSWPPEPARGDAIFGNALTTAFAVLSLTPPYQLLPVYQR